jgi:hypothetical protein
MADVKRSLLKVLLGTAVGLAIAEGAFRLRDGGAFPHLNVYVADAERGVRLLPHAEERVSFGGNPVSSVRINAQGYRGADWPAPGGDEVLVVGDSMAFGLGVEEGETFSARLEKELGGPRVVDAGVPTYGPPEYERVLAELVEQRRPKTVVYTLNVLNDPFEARRPNVERHRVWDGWAVRKESMPASWAAFPGRELLFRDSHAVFALRQWLYFKGGGSSVARGVPSDGSFADLIDLSGAIEAARKEAREETERRAKVSEAEARYATLMAVNADLHVKLLAYQTLKLGGAQASVYLASNAIPGDVVVPQQGEESSPLSASVKYVREAVALRDKLEKDLRQRAEGAGDGGKEVLRSLDERDRLEKRLHAVYAAPVQIVRASLPIVDVVLRAKALVEAKGARFVLLMLPLDVQVSEAEWKKYDEPQGDYGPHRQAVDRPDVRPARVIEDDLAAAVREAGGLVVDPTADLSAAEPGAYLNHDPHPSSKGHEAIAKALLRALRAPPAPAVPSGPLLALPGGRSRIPRPDDWALVSEYLVKGSTAAGCVTKRIREWVYVRCAPRKSGARPASARVISGGHGDALVLSNDGTVSLVAPVIRGDAFEARFSWSNPSSAERLVIHWPADVVEPEAALVEDKDPADPPPADASGTAALCRCWEEATGDKDCRAMLAAPNPDCLRTYAGQCKQLVECATGWPLRMPTCEAGQVNAGAELWCFTPCAADVSCKQGTCTETQGAKLCVLSSSVGGPAAPAPAAQEAASGGAPFAAADFDPLARAALDAAATATNVCKLVATDPGTWFSYISWDVCSWKSGEVAAYAAKAGALGEYAKGHALPSPARTVADHVRLFGEWLAAAERAQNGRGTARLFQDLVLAYDAYKPDDKRDPDPPGIVKQYTEDFGDPKVHYIWSTPYTPSSRGERMTSYKVHQRLPRPLAWRNGAQGPFLGD